MTLHISGDKLEIEDREGTKRLDYSKAMKIDGARRIIYFGKDPPNGNGSGNKQARDAIKMNVVSVRHERENKEKKVKGKKRSDVTIEVKSLSKDAPENIGKALKDVDDRKQTLEGVMQYQLKRHDLYCLNVEDLRKRFVENQTLKHLVHFQVDFFHSDGSLFKSVESEQLCAKSKAGNSFEIVDVLRCGDRMCQRGGTYDVPLLLDKKMSKESLIVEMLGVDDNVSIKDFSVNDKFVRIRVKFRVAQAKDVLQEEILIVRHKFNSSLSFVSLKFWPHREENCPCGKESVALAKIVLFDEQAAEETALNDDNGPKRRYESSDSGRSSIDEPPNKLQIQDQTEASEIEDLQPLTELKGQLFDEDHQVVIYRVRTRNRVKVEKGSDSEKLNNEGDSSLILIRIMVKALNLYINTDIHTLFTIPFSTIS